MTNPTNTWTRRQFAQVLAASAASSLLARDAAALPTERHEGFAFVGSSAPGSHGGTVRVYRTSGAAWREVHAVGAAAPAHLVMHPSLPVLYVLHDVAEWEHRPRGAVSAYRFDSATGRLTHARTQPLSLSATNPRSALVIAGGQALFVAAESGGIYNVLPIDASGNLQPVSAIRKEVGMQDEKRSSTAAPRQLVLRTSGSVFAVDPGQGTASIFTVSRDAITLQSRRRARATAPASGASTLLVHLA